MLSAPGIDCTAQLDSHLVCCHGAWALPFTIESSQGQGYRAAQPDALRQLGGLLDGRYCQPHLVMPDQCMSMIRYLYQALHTHKDTALAGAITPHVFSWRLRESLAASLTMSTVACLCSR